MSAYRVLMTKEISPALVQKAKEHDVDLEQIALIDVIDRANKPEIMEAAKKPAAVAFTSRNAVKFVGKLRFSPKPVWRIYCIEGSTSAAAVEAFGEEAIAGTARDAKSLATLILEKKEEKIFFFCGERRRDELPDILSDNGVSVEQVIVYETRLAPEEIALHFDGIAFFSPSAVESFFSVNVIDDLTIFYAIGDTTAESLKKFAQNEVIICDKASEESMVDKILSSIKKTHE